MSTNQVYLKEVAIYHPENIQNNEIIINHFKEQGKDIENLLTALGRENRYIANDNMETTLTMAIQASKRVLEKSNLSGSDIDMIVFVSGTPEYLWPPNSVSIHHAIEGKEEAVVYDMNVACVGMVVAVEQVSRNMLSNPNVNRALVVAAEQMQRYSKDDDPVTYASFGDGASAVILEKAIISNNNGFIDSVYRVNTDAIEKIEFPHGGLSKVYSEENSSSHYEQRIKWENVNNDRAFLTTVELIETLLQRNNLSTKDIKAFCLSQISRKNIIKIQEVFKEDEKKFPVVGTKYGYTGSASPFMAFEEVVKTGQVKKGDYVVFWSVGAGSTACAMLYQY